MTKPPIESLQNPKVKLAIKLRESRARRKQGLILIDGLREIDVARSAGVRFETIFCGTEQVESLLERSWPADALQPATATVMERIIYGERAGSAVAIAHPPETSLESLSGRLADHPSPLILVLDHAEKPGNIGAIVRTAATAGAQGLLLIDPECELFNPNAIRASLGTIFTLPIGVASLSQLPAWLDERGLGLVRACVDGTHSMWQADLTGPLAIALGSEAWGLGENWQRPEWPAIQIPMVTGADSLNLSVSAAILCYESLRQRVAANSESSVKMIKLGRD